MRVATPAPAGRARPVLGACFPVRAVAYATSCGGWPRCSGAVRDLDVQLERMDDPERAAAAADESGRSPLDELRRLLGSSATGPGGPSSRRSTPPATSAWWPG